MQPPPAAPTHDNAVMSKLRSATATVQRIPQWAAQLGGGLVHRGDAAAAAGGRAGAAAELPGGDVA